MSRGRFTPKDSYFHKAKKEGFAARSAYKLKDLHKKYQIFHKGQRVLDLGCSPGSWSQVASELVGPSGFVVGVDLKPVTIQLKNAEFLTLDFRDVNWESYGPFDAVISDMAPNTTGIRLRDQALSEELCRGVVDLADRWLKPGGHLVMKLFEGPEADVLVKEVGKRFKQVKRFKPAAVRKGSFETYVVGLGKSS